MKFVASLLMLVHLSIVIVGQARTNEISVQAVDRGLNFVEDLRSSDLVLTVNNSKREILSMERESRPLSIVIAVITNPYDRCLRYEGAERLELSRAFAGRLERGDQIAIVVSDKTGTTIRDFSDPSKGFSTEFSDAFQRADKNRTFTVDEYDGQVGQAGKVYPLSALQTAVELLQNAPHGNDRLIIFVKSLSNTDEGQRDVSKAILTKIASERISVSWLNSASSESQFLLANAPYGKRSFFLGLSNFTGGYYEPCEETADDSYSVLWGVGKIRNVQFDLDRLIEQTSTRYRLTYEYSDTSDAPLPVNVQVIGTSSGQMNLSFPKATTHK